MAALNEQWRIVGWQMTLMMLVMLAVYFLTSTGIFPGSFVNQQLVTAILVGWPVLLWVFFAHLPNSRQTHPIPGLILVFAICFLGARAVVLPFVDGVLQPHLWLPGARSITRLLGYTLTAGFAQECTRYFVIRYTVWGSGIRSRKDSVAYCAAGAVAYGLAINGDLLLVADLSISAVALSVLETQCMQFIGAMTLAYGMSEVRLGHAGPVVLVITMMIASFLVGLLITARAGLANAPFTQSISAARDLNGGLFILVGTVIFLTFVALLFRRAERPKPLLQVERVGMLD